MEVTFLGIDLAKNIFQLHGEDADGRAILQRRVRRDRLMTEVEALPPCTIAMEACTGAFYWQRQFEAAGHQVRIIAPQYVKPFAQHQKNDRNDAAAICRAVQQPNMKFVPGKTVEQQDIQALHRGRQRLVNHRTALVSQMRGLLLDRGVAFAQSITRAGREIGLLLEEGVLELSDLFRSMLHQLYACFIALDRQIWFDSEIEKIFRSSDTCRRLSKIRQYRDCYRRRRRRRSRVRQWQGSGGLDGTRAPTAFERQPAAPVWHIQTRRSTFANIAHPRCKGCGANFYRSG
jgi:transposase